MTDNIGTLKKIEPYGQTILIEVLPHKTKLGIIEAGDSKTRVKICRVLKVGPDVPKSLFNTEGRNVLVSSFHGIPIDFPEAALSKERFKLIVPDEIIAFWNAED